MLGITHLSMKRVQEYLGNTDLDLTLKKENALKVALQNAKEDVEKFTKQVVLFLFGNKNYFFQETANYFRIQLMSQPRRSSLLDLTFLYSCCCNRPMQKR